MRLPHARSLAATTVASTLLLFTGCGTETSPSATPEREESQEQRLVPAVDLPGVNQETVWTVTSTGPEDGGTHGSCQRFPLVDTGADEAVVREYAGGEGVRAIQVVAEFADPKSAWRASQVLTTWSKDCAGHLDAGVEKVGPLAPATVAGGKAFTQLVQYGDEGAELHTFAGIAVVRRGRLLSFVEIAVESADYNYEPGQEPATLTVPVVAERLA
jgi:hypothetical protein